MIHRAILVPTCTTDATRICSRHSDVQTLTDHSVPGWALIPRAQPAVFRWATSRPERRRSIRVGGTRDNLSTNEVRLGASTGARRGDEDSIGR